MWTPPAAPDPTYRPAPATTVGGLATLAATPQPHLFVVVDTATDQWLTGPIPAADARSLSRLSPGTHVEPLDN